MNFTLAALLLLLAVVFASYGLGFLAFIVIVILVLLAITETGAPAGRKAAEQPAPSKKHSPAAPDESFKAPGQPADYGRTSYEQFGSGVGAVVWDTARVAFNALRWAFGGKKK